MRFSEVIGQRELKRHLVRGVDAGRVSHAQLFTGRPGAGALPLALAYVQYLNCTNRRDGDSCGECPNCRQIAGLAHPDLHFVFPVNKQGKKSGEAVLSDDFMPLWRQVVSERNGYFSPQEWYDRLDLGRVGITPRADLMFAEALPPTAIWQAMHQRAVAERLKQRKFHAQ